jgi:hypothetical protein
MPWYNIFGSIERNERDEGNPLTVTSDAEGADVVVGSDADKKDFTANPLGNNFYTFELDKTGFFIGVGDDTAGNKILKLVRGPVIWAVSYHLDLTAFEVSGTGANAGLCWDLDKITIGSPIKLVNRASSPTTPRKQKWKFVRVNR